ncbi:MAG: hypothetical protein V3U92_15185 [Cellulophaga sp.]
MRKCLSLLSMLLISFYSCDDVLEENISDDLVVVITPVSGATIEGNYVQFRWNTVEGAKDYRVQVTGEHNFIVLDSLINTPIFDYQIDPGEYKWRVRGENFAYATPYTFEANFAIVASLDLSNQKVTLELPLDNKYTYETELSFSWQGIGTADSYRFQILKTGKLENTIVFEKDNLEEASIRISDGFLTDDAEYIWQVQAKNETSTSKYFKRVIFIDKQDPPSPKLVAPTNNKVFAKKEDIIFTWEFTDVGEVKSPITGTLEIASNEDFSTIVLSKEVTEEKHTSSFETSGTYYWRVKGDDEAGNAGSKSDSGIFKIN